MSAKRWSALLTASADDEAITLPTVVGRIGRPDADAAPSAGLGREAHLAEADTGHRGQRRDELQPPNDDAETSRSDYAGSSST